MKKVGIIGGSGFIGSHNTKKFLNEGYKVKASTTDISNKDKYLHLKDLPNADNLEVVELDVTDKSQLDNFLQGCQIVIHGGTPFQLDVEDPQRDLFDPTINGTDNFLEAVQKTSGIEKVIFIASVAAYNTNFPLPPDNKSEEDKISESDAPFMSNESHPYAQAKFIANQRVEKFVEDNQNLPFEIVSVSPVMVVGKSLSTREDSTSTGTQFLLKNEIAPNPFFQMFYDNNVYFAMVDVEDVADSVYNAATKNGLHGKNYLLASESYRVSDITKILNNQEPEKKPQNIYSNAMAQNELGIRFNPATSPLHKYSA